MFKFKFKKARNPNDNTQITSVHFIKKYLFQFEMITIIEQKKNLSEILFQKKKKCPKISSPHTHSKFRTNPSPIASFHSHSPLRSPIISPHNQISLTDLRRRRESLFLTSSSSPLPSPSSSSLKAMAQRPQLLYRTLLKVQKIAFAGDPKAVSCMCCKIFQFFSLANLEDPPA